jgi:hypothetical protein
MHSPEPRLLDLFAADGYDLLLAGHTHGGQLCLPFYGALVTNCGIERERVRGLHRHPADGRAWLHVSAGLGTSPWAPVRFACRPEATLLTLTPREPTRPSGVWLALCLAMREQARASARLSKSRAAPKRFRAGGV